MADEVAFRTRVYPIKKTVWRERQSVEVVRIEFLSGHVSNTTEDAYRHMLDLLRAAARER